MRLNQFVAAATGLSRRKADDLISNGQISVNGQVAQLGAQVEADDNIKFDDKSLQLSAVTTIVFNKPVGYVCSRNGQGSKTIYDLLPHKYASLKPVGRLDKDSSGLLVLTNDGQLAQQLTHPSYSKTKIYQVELKQELAPLHQQMINDHGVQLDDGLSKLALQKLDDAKHWQVTMTEGRNRQIRRTFEALGYKVTGLHRTDFGNYHLNNLAKGSCAIVY